jgi:DNA polymerase I-like protein with 3'-5' exonuclease and polymerase domains
MACTWGELPTGRWKSGQGIDFGGETLSDHLLSRGFKSLGDFTDHIEAIEKDFWGKRFRVYAKWKELWWHEYQKTGYVDLLTGFRCKGLMGKNDAINYPIQGAAFHCLLWSLIQLDKDLMENNWQSRIIGQIHDAIVLDVYPPELDALLLKIKKITTEDLPNAWDWIIVPMEIDFEVCQVDRPWSEKEELKY